MDLGTSHARPGGRPPGCDGVTSGPAGDSPSASVTSGQRVARNVLYGAAGQLWSLILLVITIPIVVRGLGESAYGVFVLVSVLLSYVAFLDLGLTPAVVRSIAVHFQLAGAHADHVRAERHGQSDPQEFCGAGWKPAADC